MAAGLRSTARPRRVQVDTRAVERPNRMTCQRTMCDPPRTPPAAHPTLRESDSIRVGGTLYGHMNSLCWIPVPDWVGDIQCPRGWSSLPFTRRASARTGERRARRRADELYLQGSPQSHAPGERQLVPRTAAHPSHRSGACCAAYPWAHRRPSS